MQTFPQRVRTLTTHFLRSLLRHSRGCGIVRKAGSRKISRKLEALKGSHFQFGFHIERRKLECGAIFFTI